MPTTTNQLLSDDLLAKGPTPPDVSKTFDSYFAGAQQANQQALQNLFSDPSQFIDPATGQFDYAKAARELMRVGGAAQLPNALNLLNQKIIQDPRFGAPPTSPDITLPQAPRPSPAPPSISRPGPQSQDDTEPPTQTASVRPPGQNVVQPSEVPGSAKISVAGGPEEPLEPKPVQSVAMTTARSLAERTGQDPQVVAEGLGLTDPDQAISVDAVRQRLAAIRPPAPDQSKPEQPQQVAEKRPQVTVPARAQPAPQPAAIAAPIEDINHPQYWSLENAAAYEKRARELEAGAAALAGVPGGAAKAQILGATAQRVADTAKQIREVAAKNDPTFQRQQADIPEDVKEFRGQNKAIQEAGQNADISIPKIQQAKALTLDPNFTSGPWAQDAELYQQFKSLFGANIQAATPMEAFKKYSNDLLQERIKSLGQAGVRVLRSEIPIMQNAIATPAITPSSNRAILEMNLRMYQLQSGLAEATRGLPAKSAVLNQAVQNYVQQHPLFTDEEKRNPVLLGSPDAPQGSTNWSVQQWRNWGAQQGLRPNQGTPGQPGFVPGDTIKSGNSYFTIP